MIINPSGRPTGDDVIINPKINVKDVKWHPRSTKFGNNARNRWVNRKEPNDVIINPSNMPTGDDVDINPN